MEFASKERVLKIGALLVLLATGVAAQEADYNYSSSHSETSSRKAYAPSANRIQPVAEQQNSVVMENEVACQCGEGSWLGLERSKRFEIGLNGAEGNSRNLNLVMGYDATTKFGLNSFAVDIDYFYSFDEDEVTRNRFLSLYRYIHGIADSDWDLLFDTWFEYDELEDFRSRLGFHFGGIYTFVDTEPLVLKGIIGLGTSNEFRGTDQGWRPEGILGGLFERKIGEFQKVYVKTAYYPNLEQTSSFRWNTKAGWETKLNPDNLYFSISCFDRYDSTPSAGDRRNNIDYWASLLIAY